MEPLFDRLAVIRCKLEAGIDLSEGEKDTLNNSNARAGQQPLAAWSEEELKEYGSIYRSTDERYLRFSEQHMQDAIKEDAEIVDIKRSRLSWKWLVSGAAAVVVIVAGYFLIPRFATRQPTQVVPERSIVKNDIPPGSAKAILTLADGSQVALDNTADSFVTMQGNTSINQPKPGQLAYNGTTVDHPNAQLIYNTVQTPNGGKYEIILPDGTKIWLNASSSIRFPVAFTGNERNVEISGEVFFEVAHNRSPFQVRVNSTIVQTKGTTFNIMAYHNEEGSETTLLDGQVNIISDNKTLDLKKGQQAIIKQGSAPKTITANIESVVAWKNDSFYLKDKKLKDLFRQIERWYNAKVEVKDATIGDLDITFGPISRNIPASEIFASLKLNNHLTYKIDGSERTITVYKKEQSADAEKKSEQKKYLASVH